MNFAPGSTKIPSLFSVNFDTPRPLRPPSTSDISGGVFDDNPIYTSEEEEEAEAALIVPSLNLSVASRGDSDARRELAA